MLDHLEEAFCVYGVDVYFGLQSAHLGGPGHGFASDAVGSELHQALVEGVEVALVLDVHAFLDDRQLSTGVELLPQPGVVGLIVFIALAFHIKVEIYRHDRELTQSTTCLKVSVLGLLMAAQLLQHILGCTNDGLSQSLEELDVQVERAFFSVRAVGCS